MAVRGGFVYIMSNKKRTVFYIGVTSNLLVRVTEHKELSGSQFASKYNCVYLIYYEGFTRIEEAIHREKQMKKWKREWKERIIKEMNPKMKDLTSEIEYHF